VSVVVPVNPKVIRWARESVGVSPWDAAARIKVDVSVIRAWEDGSAQPTIGPLRELSEFYRRPLAAFLLKTLPKDPPDPADFRVMKGGSRHSLTRQTRQALNRAFELRALAADLERQEPGPRTSGRRVLDDERTPFHVAAAETRKALGIGIEEQRGWSSVNKALNAWRRALERRGILVFAMTMPKTEVRGFSISGPGGPPAIVLNTADTEPGRIFTLFHEYCHVLMGTGGICLPSTAIERHSLQGRELYCNRFAGAVLVPEEVLSAMPEALKLGTSAETPTDAQISAVAGVFNVSKQVLWYRLRDTGLISTQRFAAKWPLWHHQKTQVRPKRKGGPKAPVRVLSSRGLRFTSLVLDANHEQLITTNETLDYLAIQLGDLEAVEQEARRRAVG
jgi:Zn-dependent peptidase ImmA (M78 family)